ncbi:MAG: hypothetical protein ACRCZF_09645 [Gemmataceae bacterium]
MDAPFGFRLAPSENAMRLLDLIQSSKIDELCSATMDGHIKYGFGSKAALNAKAADIKAIDCSGYVRWFLYQGTNGTLRIPDGSWVQKDWCEKQGLQEQVYANDACKLDQIVRIAFLPSVNGHAGHVWLLYGGMTIESHGSKGPNRRSWDTPVLKNSVNACFAIACSVMVGDFPTPRKTDVMYA